MEFPMPHGLFRRAAVPVVLAASLLTGGLASPASAQEPVDLCETLAVTITFDDAAYAGGDTATLTITVTNNGPNALQGLTTGSGGGQPNELVWDSSNWGELDSTDDAPGMSIGAGETRTVAGTGLVPATAADYGNVYVLAPFLLKDGSNTCSPAFTAEADVTGKVGDLTGKAVNVRNGAGVRGAIIAVYEISEESPCRAVTTSGADGVFTFTDLPAGHYIAQYVPPHGWRGTEGYSEEAAVGADNRPLTFRIERGASGIPYESPAGCPDIAPPTSAPPTTSTAGIAPAAQGRTAPALADTGGVPTELVPVGLGLLLAGGAAVLAARRGRARHPA
jgi:hypothetical protein